MTKIATRAVRAGIDCDTAFGAVTPPIVLSANFTFEEFGKKRAYDYSRSGNPTRDHLANALASLEGGTGGVITSTGMIWTGHRCQAVQTAIRTAARRTKRIFDRPILQS